MIFSLYAKGKRNTIWCFVLIFWLSIAGACANGDSDCIEPCGIAAYGYDGDFENGDRGRWRGRSVASVESPVSFGEPNEELLKLLNQRISFFDAFEGEESAVHSDEGFEGSDFEGSDEEADGGFELVALSTSLISVFDEDEAMLENASDIFDISGRPSTRIYVGLVLESQIHGAFADVAMYWTDPRGSRRLRAIASTQPGFDNDMTLSSLVLWIADFPANCDAWVRGWHSVEFEIDDDLDGGMDRVIAAGQFLIADNFYLPLPPLLHLSQDEIVEQEPLQVRLLVDGYSLYTLLKSLTPTFDESEAYDVSSGFYEFISLPVGTQYLRAYASNSCGRTDFGSTVSVLVHEEDGDETEDETEVGSFEVSVETRGEGDSANTYDDEERAESASTAVSPDEEWGSGETIEPSGDHITGGEEEDESANMEPSELIEETSARDREDPEGTEGETGGETNREGSDDCGEGEHTQRDGVSSDEEVSVEESAADPEDCNGQPCPRMWHDFSVRCPTEDAQCEVHCWYAETEEGVGVGDLLIPSLSYVDICMWGIDCNAVSFVQEGVWYSDLGWLLFLRASLDGVRVNGYIETDMYGTNLHFSKSVLGCP